MVEITCFNENGKPLDNLVQWDVNRTIQIKDLDLAHAPIVHFSKQNMSTAMSIQSTMAAGIISVQVPNILLQDSERIFVYIYDYDDDTHNGQTVYLIKIPVIKKPKPDDYVFEENIAGINLVSLTREMKRVNSLINQFNSAVQTEKTNIQKLSMSEQDKVTAKGTAAVTSVNNAVTTGTNTINSTVNTGKQAITTAQTTAVNAVTTKQSDATKAITTAQTNATNAITTKQTAAIKAIDDKIATIPSDYAELTKTVDQLTKDVAAIKKQLNMS